MKIRIRDFDQMGNGIGTNEEGKVYFVENALIGETVEIADDSNPKKLQTVNQFIQTSNCRQDAFCPLFPRCGSCQIQHLRYDETLKWKKNRVVDCLHRIGKFALEKIEATSVSEMAIASPEIHQYRNNARFHIHKNNKGQYALGFRESKSHQLVAQTSDECVVIGPCTRMIRQLFCNFLNESHLPETCILSEFQIRESRHTDDLLLVLYGKVKEEAVIKELRVLLKEFAESLTVVTKEKNKVLAGFVLHYEDSQSKKRKEVLYGSPYLSEKLHDKKCFIGDQSFFQVNTLQAENMIQWMKEIYLKKTNAVPKEIWDVYGGTGTLGMSFIEQENNVRVFELNKEAEKYGLLQAKENGLSNQFQYFLGDASVTLAKAKDSLPHPDLVITDPPRQGLSASSLSSILAVKPEHWIYVSCDPATFARDMKQIASSYELVAWQAMDMFPWTTHVESVVLMSRVDK